MDGSPGTSLGDRRPVGRVEQEPGVEEVVMVKDIVEVV